MTNFSTARLAQILLLILTLIGLPLGMRTIYTAVSAAPSTLLLSLGITALILGLFVLIFSRTSLWPTGEGSLWWLPVAVVWGGFTCAIWVDLAGPALSTLMKQLGMPIFSASLAGAMPEEIGKLLGVLLIALAFRRISAPWHVFILAIFVGLGFTLTEDIGYAAAASMIHPASDVSGAITIWVMRTASGLSLHSVYTAIAAWGVARALFAADWSRGKKWTVSFLWAVLGFLLHFAWNSSPSDAMINLLKLAVVGLASLILIVVIFLRARRMARAHAAGVGK